jgi:hypothetical protein
LTGAAGGAAGSFVGGAGNAWANGASFRDGLKAGLIGGGWGALGGAVLVGISGGITAYRHGGNLLTGEGATFESVANVDPSKPVTLGEGMEYSNKYAKNFSDAHFEDVRGVKNLYADGTMPEGYIKVGDYVQNLKSKDFVDGLTTYLGKGKNSNVYLYKNAFTSPEKLFLTMGHEYIHAGFNSLGNSFDVNKQEAVAWDWSNRQSHAWNLSGYESGAAKYASYNTGFYSYRLSRIGRDFMKLINKPQWYLIKK